MLTRLIAKRPAWMALLSLALLAAVPFARGANTITYGPLDDGSTTVDPYPEPVEKWLQTRWAYAYMAGNDLIHVRIMAPSTTYYSSRVFVTVPDPLPVKGGSAIVTTIYGTLGEDHRMTGFTPGGKQFVPLSPETQMGTCDKTGRTFTSHWDEEVAAADLPRYLAGLDLHQFDTTSLNVYHVFKTKVPLSALMK